MAQTMEDKIDYSVVKVADLQKGLVLAPRWALLIRRLLKH